MPEKPPLRQHQRPLPATRADLAAQLAAEESAAGALQAARLACEKLFTNIGILTAGGGVAALLSDPKIFTKLSGRWEAIAEVTFVAGAATAIGTMVIAMLASQVKFTRGIISGQDWHERELSEATRAIVALRRAREGAIASVVLLVVSLGLAWLAPTGKSGELRVTGVTKAGEVVCGTFASQGTNVVVKEADRRFKVRALHAVRTAKTC